MKITKKNCKRQLEIDIEYYLIRKKINKENTEIKPTQKYALSLVSFTYTKTGRFKIHPILGKIDHGEMQNVVLFYPDLGLFFVFVFLVYAGAPDYCITQY